MLNLELHPFEAGAILGMLVTAMQATEDEARLRILGDMVQKFQDALRRAGQEGRT